MSDPRTALPASERIRSRLLGESQRVRTLRARRALIELHGSSEQATVRQASPVILLGMHRSGTSLTARILTRLGVHMGADASTANHESLGFVMRNRTVLGATGAEWDRPRPFLDAVRDPEWRRVLSLVLDSTLTEPTSWLLGLREPPVDVGEHGWGWKDPRNTLTWPVWLDLYPDARFVRVRRERPGVIASLTTRSHENLRRRADLSIRTLTAAGADALCDEYDDALAPLDDCVADHRVFDLRYEDLLDDPVGVVTSLAQWVGAGPDEVDSAAALVASPPPTGR